MKTISLSECRHFLLPIMGPEELFTIQELPGSNLIGRPGLSLLQQAADSPSLSCPTTREIWSPLEEDMKALPAPDAKSSATNLKKLFLLRLPCWQSSLASLRRSVTLPGPGSLDLDPTSDLQELFTFLGRSGFPLKKVRKPGMF